MIREIVRDEMYLAQKAEPATPEDLSVGQDLLDTLEGTRPAKRWQSIKVRYQNEKFQERFKTFTGWTAQIIQHEVDHCEGIII